MLKALLVLTLTLNPRLSRSLPPMDLVPVTLSPDSEFRCCSDRDTNRDQPTVYCYHGTHKTLGNLWQTVSVLVDMKPPQKYDLYMGKDECDVWAQYESSQSRWNFNIFNWGRRNIPLNPFHTTCLGVRTVKDYTLRIRVTQVDKLLLGMFTLGALLFFLAPVLVHNKIFYYITGIAFGVLVSLLVFLYFVITMVPLKRPAMLGMMAGGSTIIFYFFQSLLDNILTLIPVYTRFVYAYLIVSSLISFVVCYRFGPMTNRRSKDLIQWSLQFVSLLLVFYSSYIQEVTVVASITIVLLYKFPVTKWLISAVQNVNWNASHESKLVPRRSTFVTRRSRRSRYLTEEEYHEQGRAATERGLQEIRQYCKTSPRRRWKVRRNEKFTKFLTGESHLSAAEVEAKMMEELLTDEEE